jgi:methyl-accepting chemotaxis protein
MFKVLKFSHKILLTASLVVTVAFSLFILYIDNLQRTNTQENIQRHLDDVGYVVASNIQSWVAGRINVIENMAQSLEWDPSTDNIQNALTQAAQQDGQMARSIQAPRLKCPRVTILESSLGIKTL